MANERSFPVCCYCGACAAFIPDFKKYSEEEVVWDKGYGAGSMGFCFSFCPHTFAACRLCEGECPRMAYGICDFSPCASKPEGRIIGYYNEILSARATDEGIRGVGQDGSVVTAMLCEALRTGFIDAVVVATKTEDWKAEPFVATTPEEVLLASGSKYTACPSVLGVWEAIDRGYENIAMVGTGCNIEAVRRLQSLHDSSLELEKVKLLVGLFCTEAFWHHDLMMFLLDREEIDISEVKKFDISKGNFIVTVKDKEFRIPIKDVEHCVRDTCKLCDDFSAQLADISAGSAGTPPGRTTLVIRTAIGEAFMNTSKGAIETEKITPEGLKEIEKFSWDKKNRNYGMIRDQMEICSACFTNPYSFILKLKRGE